MVAASAPADQVAEALERAAESDALLFHDPEVADWVELEVELEADLRHERERRGRCRG